VDPVAKAFIRASLVWLVLGVTLGFVMAAWPSWIVYRPAHAHLTLVGFVMAMIFGVGYQMLPRFFGGAVHSPALARLHFWLANLGLAVLIGGFALSAQSHALGRTAMLVGGALWLLGAYLFAYNMWRSFDAGDARRAARD
jgi:cbb3-type cytochrome oxidase subunit 1